MASKVSNSAGKFRRLHLISIIFISGTETMNTDGNYQFVTKSLTINTLLDNDTTLYEYQKVMLSRVRRDRKFLNRFWKEWLDLILFDSHLLRSLQYLLDKKYLKNEDDVISIKKIKDSYANEVTESLEKWNTISYNDSHRITS